MAAEAHMKRAGYRTRNTIFLLLLTISGGAFAQSETPWDSAYFGVNMGDASGNTCSAWTPNGAGIDSGSDTVLSNQTCAGGGHFVGGVQLGDNFQYKRLAWGLGVDLDAAASKSATQSVKYSGESPPPGTYVSSGRQNPNGFAVIGPRIGYAGDLFLPYLRAGALIASGAHDSVLSFTPAKATKPTVSFDGGRNFSSVGWAAGAGTEIGLNGPWSISLEYLHANLGKGSSTTAACSGPVAACAAFSGISFDNIHDGFTANIYRIGITYWFGYWGR
ncbi:MAG: outer membrane beta-barrel protein [Steroidobacteraceae bacterium]|jgi:opacity protein-like surface antigen